MKRGGDMRRDVALKILDAGERVLQSESYCRLLEEYRRLDIQVLGVLKEIDPRQRDILMAYLGVLGEMNLRLMEEACSDE